MATHEQPAAGSVPAIPPWSAFPAAPIDPDWSRGARKAGPADLRAHPPSREGKRSERHDGEREPWITQIGRSLQWRATNNRP